MGKTARSEVDENYAVFMNLLPQLLAQHRNKFALLKDGKLVGCYSTLEDAYVTAENFFGDEPFSVQKVTDLPVDLGFFSHAVDLR